MDDDKYPDRVLSLEDLEDELHHEKQNSLVVSPKSVPIRLWEVTLAISAVIACLCVTVQAAFDGSALWSIGLLYACDITYIIGIISHLFIGYEEKGIIVTNMKQIALQYFKSTLILDILSIIPLEITALAAGYSDYYAAFLRLNRFLRCYRLWQLCSKREKELGSNTSIIRATRFIYLAAMSIHIQACVWFVLACDNVSYSNATECKQGSWANDPETISLDINLAVSSVFEKYIMALYWAVATTTSTGYGDIHPLLEGEKWFSILCMLWGTVMFGYILGGLASMLSNSDAQRARYVHRLDAIQEYLKDAGVSAELQNKVIGYYEYLWVRNKGKEGTEAFNELPIAFQAELSLETYQNMILKSHLFKDTPQGFIRMLSTMVKHMLYLPNQVIANKGDIGHNMYFIHKGLVEVLTGDHDDMQTVAEFKEGDMFGEVNLVYSVTCQALVRAKTHCDVLMINKRDVVKALQHFPNVSNRLKEVIQERCEIAITQESESQNSKPVESSNIKHTHKQSRKGSYTSDNYQSKWDRLVHFLFNEALIPKSRFILIWDILVLITILGATWLYSFQAGFSHFNPSLGYSSVSLGRLRFLATYLIDVVFLIDIVITFKKAIPTASGYETNMKMIAISYLTSLGFMLDIVAILPIEIAALAMSDHLLDWAITLKINRILKLWKIFAWLRRLENSLNFSIAKTRAIKFILYIVGLTHLLSCVWFPLACNTEGSCKSTSWAAEHSVTSNTSVYHDYIISLYWAAATLTSTGYGDVTAVNTVERIIALIVMLIGLSLFGYILGAVAATIANGVLPRVTFQEKMQVVHQFMSDNMLSKGLLERVDHFFSLLWGQTKGEALPGEDRLLSSLPQSLQEDVGTEECSELLSNVVFFQHTDTSFLRQLSLKTVTYLFAPGDIVLYYGDIGREMYCVRRGYVEVLSEDLSQVVTVIGPGGNFGELGFLFGSPRTATVRAATHCELVMLSRYDMNHVVESFPLLAKQFEDISNNKEHMEVAKDAASESSRLAMLHPHRFAKPCILAALAAAMGPPLSIITRTPMTNAIASTVGSKDSQSKVSCPISLSPPETGTIVKYDRKKDEIQRNIQGPEEGGHGGLRHRHHTLRSTQVVPVRSTEIETIGITQSALSIPQATLKGITNILEKMLSYCLIPYSFIAQSKPGVTWEILATVLGIITTISISLQAAFFHSFAPYCIPLWIVNYALDLFFIIDIILKIHTAYYSSDGVLITRPVECAKNYFKTNLLFDLIGSFPTEIILPLLGLNGVENISRILSLVRLNRIVRIYKLPLIFDYLEDQVTRSTGLITEVKFAAYMLVGTHLTACVWFLLACSSLSNDFSDPHTCNVNSWALKEPFSATPLGNYTIGYQYVVSMYWASATTISVGYGDIHAHTDIERMFALSVMIIGIVSYGYIIATVAASLANADSGRARYQEKLKAINNYLQDQNMDVGIQKRVVNYYEYIWQRTKGMSFGSLFNGMPKSLQADISLSLYKKIIDEVPLFQNTEIGFTKLLALSIKPVLYLSKEYIVRKGDIGSEMFFINRGTVEVVSEDGEVVFAKMNEGKFFGEISLVFSCPRTASIRAATNCDLFVLTKTNLDASLKYYPHIAEQIREVAGNRANLVKKRSQAAAKAAAEGKSASDAAKAAAQVNKEEDKDDEGGKKVKRTLLTGEALSTDQNSDIQLDSDEEQRPTLLQECLEHCRTEIKETIWPALKPFLTFTISPVGKFGVLYSYIGCLLAYFSAFTISYQVFFQSKSPVLWAINYLFEAYFFIEIFIRFHMGYEDAKGRIVSDFKSVALHYLKTPSAFPLDLIAILPFEIIGLPIPDSAISKAVILYFRVLHIIRVVRIRDFFTVEEKRLNQKTVLIRLLKFIVLISLSTHFVACLWYLLACQTGECNPNTWAEVAGLVKTNARNSLHYCNSLYWAVATMTSTGYGDYSATNALEMMFASIVMLFGKLLFGFILGSIASTLANLEMQRVLFEEKLSAIKDYMKEQHLSGMLQNRVLKFFDYIWVRNKGVDRQSLLEDMPSCMQAEVSLATTENLIKRVPIFSSVNPAFLRHLTLKIKPCLFLPKEYIVHKGDIGQGIFFIYHGTVEAVDEDPKSVVKATLHEGHYFGQKNLLYNLPREISIQAKTHCDIFSLTPEDFTEVLKCHPNLEQQIAQTALELYGMPIPSATATDSH